MPMMPTEGGKPQYWNTADFNKAAQHFHENFTDYFDNGFKHVEKKKNKK